MMISSLMAARHVTVGSVLAKASVAAVLFSAIMSGMAASASGDMSAEAKGLAKLDDDWSVAAATRDAKSVASFYAEDGIAYPPNQPTAIGRAEAEKVWAAYFSDPTYRISWKTTHAEVTGTLGYTTGIYEDSFKGPDGKTINGNGRYLCVWRKGSDGTWKVVHDMWNTDSK
jgi:ketosteroid isomerase-like protein